MLALTISQALCQNHGAACHRQALLPLLLCLRFAYEDNAATLPRSPVLKRNKLLLPVQTLSLFNNQLEGSLPESWGNLTSVIHGFELLIQVHTVGVPQKLQQIQLGLKSADQIPQAQQ